MSIQNIFEFTKVETNALLRNYGLFINEEVNEIHEWYRFKKTNVYNPWSLLNYVTHENLVQYYANIYDNFILKILIDHKNRFFESD